jgi:hypothetical protein
MSLRRSSGNPSSAIKLLKLYRSAIITRFLVPQRSRQFVGTFSKPTSTRRSSLQYLHVVPVRPVRVTGHTGVTGKIRRKTNVARAGSHRCGTRKVFLGSAGQPGRLETSRRWRKNNMNDPTGHVHRSDRCTRCVDLVKSKLSFVDIGHTGLTGGTHRSDRSDQTCQLWVRTVWLLKK